MQVAQYTPTYRGVTFDVMTDFFDNGSTENFVVNLIIGSNVGFYSTTEFMLRPKEGVDANHQYMFEAAKKFIDGVLYCDNRVLDKYEAKVRRFGNKIYIMVRV